MRAVFNRLFGGDFLRWCVQSLTSRKPSSLSVPPQQTVNMPVSPMIVPSKLPSWLADQVVVKICRDGIVIMATLP